jgi:methyl-accepting chemotaxis protein
MGSWIYWVGGIFFAFQILSCVATVRFLEDHRRSIEGLVAGGDKWRLPDRPGAWLTWVAEVFPEGTVAGAGWSRDDAFEMLDETVTAHQWYQCLQRLAVMAPLVGVLITAFGLKGLHLDADKALTIATILDAISPLFSGVIAGALLAIVNQVLLQVVQRQIEQLRVAARRWFDREVWAHAVDAPREAVGSMIDALKKVAGSIGTMAQVQDDNALRVRVATTSIVQASLASEEAFQGFKTGLAEFSAQIRTLQQATESTRQLAESMGPSLRQARDALLGTVEGFRKAVDDRFIPAAKDHAKAAKFSAETSEKTLAILKGIDATTLQLVEQGTQLVASTRDLGQSGDELKKSIEGHLVPAQRSLREASGTLNRAADIIPGLFETCAAAFASTAAGLRTTLENDLAPAATLLHQTISEDLKPTAAKQKRIVKEIAVVTDGLQTLFLQVQAASKSLEARYDRLAEAANRQSSATEEIHESLKEKLIPAQQAIGESAADLAGSAKALSRFLAEGLDPATVRLAELAQVIGPMREAVAVFGALGDLKGEIRDLSSIVQGLRQAVDSAKALADLQSIIEQLTGSFTKADELRRTVAEMPDLFARRIDEMTNRALRRQGDDLKETLSDIVKQFGWFAPGVDGQAEGHR